ncbi:MAG: helix-turn-helix transcriptional regulator [Methanobacterium sp.]|uniref:TetR/AcrR family transcriptional regulator n=1 Tax=Methanobacterium sp. TaxID=2164 RepID=UPI003D655B1D|nr:helix-turn-helix transcriptional regulator [Methanobacterium sp.]
MSKRMERKKEEKKKVILDAAEELIAKKSIIYMTMDQVAKEADVAKGTLYLYFKNKESLCAAVNTRLNREINCCIKEKMDLYATGSEKTLAVGTAIIEYSIKNPQKWKTATELYQMSIDNPEDPNVQEFMGEVNKMVHMLAAAYRQGISEGDIRKDVDPVPTAIYNRMAFSNVLALTSEQSMVLKLNDISQKRYLSVAWNLINRSTHIKPSLREESDKSLEYHRSEEDIGKEIKTMADSMGLQAEDAVQIRDAWLTLTRIIMGGVEHETIENTSNRVIENVTLCPAFNSHKETGATPDKNMIEGCPRYCTILVETLNSKYAPRFTKKMCAGDDFCEVIIELK